MSYRLLCGDALDVLETLEPQSVHCVVTSPPYFGLRDYGEAGQLGLESTPEEYVRAMVTVFDRVRRVLRDDGVMFVNLGDSYASGDTRPSQSRSDVPAYDTDGRELQGCLLTGSACLGPCGGPTACHLFHNADTIRRQSTSAPVGEKIGRGTDWPDSSAVAASAPGVPASTIPSSSHYVADDSGLASEALESQTEQPTSSACGPRCEHRTAFPCEHPTIVAAQQGQPLRTSCTSETDGALADRTKGTAFDWFSCPYYTTTFRQTQLKPKDLVGIPWRVAFALQAAGWYLRSDIIWAKVNPMPESVTDRPTKAHEYLFLLTKQPKYYYDATAIKEASVEPVRAREKFNGESAVDTKMRGHNCNCGNSGTRNKRTVWTIATESFSGAHFATFPQALVKPCILAGTSERGVCPACGKPWTRVVERGMTSHDGETDSAYPTGTTANRLAQLRQAARRNGGEYANGTTTTGWRAGCACDAGEPIPATVLDPFCGSGTTGLVALSYGRDFVGIDLSAEYLALAEKRIAPAAAQGVLL